MLRTIFLASLIMMWVTAMVGMYNLGCLDTLDWSKRLLNGESSPKAHIRWKDIAFYVVPLAVFTSVGIYMLTHGEI
jgi:hypothetical protein